METATSPDPMRPTAPVSTIRCGGLASAGVLAWCRRSALVQVQRARRLASYGVADTLFLVTHLRAQMKIALLVLIGVMVVSVVAYLLFPHKLFISLSSPSGGAVTFRVAPPGAPWPHFSALNL
jgi:hypothetical protein